MISFDLETRIFQPGNYSPPIVVGSFQKEGEAPYLLLTPDRVADEVERILQTKQTIVGAKVAFDFCCILAHRSSLTPLVFQAYEDNRVFDVLIAVTLDLLARGYIREHNGKTVIIDPRTNEPLKAKKGDSATNISLENAVSLILGREDAKKNDYWKKRYGILEHVPFADWPEEAKQYPLDDAANTLEVGQRLLQKGFGNQDNLSDQCRAAFALELGSIWGIKTDKNYVEQLAQKTEKLYQEAIKKFHPLGFLDLSGKENQKVLKSRIESAYGKDTPYTGKGNVSISREVLLESGDKELQEYAEAMRVKKNLKTYIPWLHEGFTYPINFQPNVLVASGRTSYKGLIQTLPRDGGLRDAFTARDGYLFCSVDYSALELYSLAQCQLWICHSSVLADALNNGLDPHCLLASQMLGVTYEAFVKIYKDVTHPLHKKYKAYRQAAKPANFGFPGGMGAPTLVESQREQTNLRFCTVLEGRVCGEKIVTRWEGKDVKRLCLRCVELAEQIRDNWFTQWPEMDSYFKFVSRELKRNGNRLTQYVSKRVRGGLSFCPASNTLFQGLAADGAKAALWDVSKEMYAVPSSPLFGGRPTAFVHDEIFSELLEDRAHEAAHRKTRLMIDAMRRYIPDVDVKAEPCLSRRWYKEAQAVYKEGRLVPWQP